MKKSLRDGQMMDGITEVRNAEKLYNYYSSLAVKFSYTFSILLIPTVCCT